MDFWEKELFTFRGIWSFFRLYVSQNAFDDDEKKLLSSSTKKFYNYWLNPIDWNLPADTSRLRVQYSPAISFICSIKRVMLCITVVRNSFRPFLNKYSRLSLLKNSVSHWIVEIISILIKHSAESISSSPNRRERFVPWACSTSLRNSVRPVAK